MNNKILLTAILITSAANVAINIQQNQASENDHAPKEVTSQEIETRAFDSLKNESSSNEILLSELRTLNKAVNELTRTMHSKTENSSTATDEKPTLTSSQPSQKFIETQYAIEDAVALGSIDGMQHFELLRNVSDLPEHEREKALSMIARSINSQHLQIN